MVDATVSMVLTRLAPMIEQRVRDEVCMMINSIDEANKLASKLKIIKELLDDAELKGVTDPKVKSWLNELEDISYEMDDVLDEMEWENTWLQMEGLEVDQPASDPWHKVASFLESVCLCIQRNIERRNINWNIKNMNKRLDGIREQNEKKFNFVPNVGGYSQDSKLTRETASFVEISKVHGRDDDKEILVSKLLSEGSSQMEPDTPVISIVGVGGLGKTTLAQLLFNDKKVEDHFEVKVWVCVSELDQIGVAKAILEHLTEKKPDPSSLQTLLQAIEKAISGKIFLLILDDVWTEDRTRTMWEHIKNSLRKCKPGSRILVTTRNENVARVMGSNAEQIHRLSILPDSECWKVFKQIAFDGGEVEKDLEAIGRKIVEKCNGLPLAAKAMGGLLYFKRNSNEWRRVLESPLWEETAKKDIFPFLVLSYNELSPVAKRCFSYCAIFPKDTNMEVSELILFWCAQGFFSSDDMELVGRETFDDLAMRSFFQDFQRGDNEGKIISCKMHDIVHDFAQFLTKDESVIGKSIDCGKKSRHFYLVADKDESKATASAIAHGKWCGYEKCRSFFTDGCAIPLDLLKHLKRVRVLVMDDCELEEIPSEIGSKIHLRYLGLGYNPIKQLPEDICNLYNLRTLSLEGCEQLRSLPEGIHKLQKLRHLLLDEFPRELPQGLGELTNLETLRICAWRRNWYNLVLLRNLNRLRYLSIIMKDSGDPNEAVRVAEIANLKAKNLMEYLILYCKEHVPIQAIEALQPHPDLKLLVFRCTCLPQWFTTLTRLRDLQIGGVHHHWEEKSDDAIKGITSLPALGTLMPFLESLVLLNLFDMERLSREFLGISAEHTIVFPRLKTLTFSGCKSWKEWEDISPEEAESNSISVFPSLQTLEIMQCFKLKALPHRFLWKAASLANFKINHCDKLQADYIQWQESRRQG